MCIICDARREAVENDDFEMQQTLEAMVDPQVFAGATLMIGALLEKFGLNEFTFNPKDLDITAMAGLEFRRDGDVLTARRVRRDEIAAVAELLASGGDPKVVN